MYNRTFISYSSLVTSVGDPYLWLMDPDPDPTPDLTPFFSDFKDAKKLFFFHFFLITYPQAHYLQSKKLKVLLKFCVKILFCGQYFSPLITCMWKGKDPEPDPYLWLMDPNPDSGGPKTCESGSVSGSPILVINDTKRLIAFPPLVRYREIKSFLNAQVTEKWIVRYVFQKPWFDIKNWLLEYPFVAKVYRWPVWEPDRSSMY